MRTQFSRQSGHFILTGIFTRIPDKSKLISLMPGDHVPVHVHNLLPGYGEIILQAVETIGPQFYAHGPADFAHGLDQRLAAARLQFQQGGGVRFGQNKRMTRLGWM